MSVGSVTFLISYRQCTRTRSTSKTAFSSEICIIHPPANHTFFKRENVFFITVHKSALVATLARSGTSHNRSVGGGGGGGRTLSGDRPLIELELRKKPMRLDEISRLHSLIIIFSFLPIFDSLGQIKDQKVKFSGKITFRFINSLHTLLSSSSVHSDSRGIRTIQHVLGTNKHPSCRIFMKIGTKVKFVMKKKLSRFYVKKVNIN